jgi:acetyltransferase-like isoleucine patch superfamily enzyme
MADVGANCIVSAGSVVTKPMPAGMTAIGNPARFLKAMEAEK